MHKETVWMFIGSLLGVLGGACGQAPSNTGDAGHPPVTLTLQASAASIPSDFFTTSEITVAVTASSGTPPSGRVFLTTTAGRFVGSRVGSTGQTTVVDLFTSATGTTQVQCTNPDGVTQELGTMRIHAASADDGLGEAVSNTVEVACTGAQDRSALRFSAPRDGDSINMLYFYPMQLELLDFHGGLAAGPGVVRVVSVDGLGLQVAPPQTGSPFIQTSLDVPFHDGVASFWVQSPGESLTTRAPVPFQLQASFTNSAGIITSATGHFTWGASGLPDLTRVPFTRVVGAAPGVDVYRQYLPPRALMHAGQDALWVEFLLVLVDWAGQPWMAAQDVTVTCVPDERDAAAGVENCKALSGRDPAPGGTAQVEHAAQVVLTALPGGTGPTGPGAQAVVRYQAAATSLPGTVRLVASFTHPSGLVFITRPQDTAWVSLVDANSLTVWPEGVPSNADASHGQARALTLRAFDGDQPAGNLLVCASLDDAGATWASLDDADDDVGGPAVVTHTGSGGVASILVHPVQAAQPTAADVAFTVASLPYSPALDDNTLTDQMGACSALGGATAVTGTETFVFPYP